MTNSTTNPTLETAEEVSSVYVDTAQQLATLCQQWSQAAVLALDTEFIRTDTFYPIAALIQICDGEGIYLIDPLAVGKLEPLAAVMVEPSVVKLLHSCSEDLEVFKRLLGVVPTPLLDTQVGAALAGFDFSMSYQRLVDAVLDRHVPKGETRSDWLRRPLSAAQIHYAALDVAYLIPVYEAIKQRLDRNDRMTWWQQDSQTMLDKFADTPKPAQYYLKVKRAWQLDRRGLAILKAVVEWREQRARDKDIPRGRVLKDSSCIDIAHSQPTSAKSLANIKDISPGRVRRDADTLLQFVESVLQLNIDELPQQLPRPLPGSANQHIKQLKAIVETKSEQLAVPREMLARKQDYEHLLRHRELSASLAGWRKAVIGDELLAFSQGVPAYD